MTMELLGVRPGRRIIVYFLVAITAGTILLSLPVSSGGPDIGIINALFTATSAVCVTGLTVVDTGHDYSLFGQIVILVLIQLGGLGIMTFATTLLVSIGARLSFHDRLEVSQSFTVFGRKKLPSILTAVALTTISFELIGALLLFIRFKAKFPLGQAVYYSIFHSVSAFCNAGFSTFSNSLEGFNNDIFIVLVFAVLIIGGGLGFVVIAEITNRLSDKESKLSLHSKLCLVTTFVLLIAGTFAFYFIEYNNAFQNMGIFRRAVNAFFQAVTCRTAGFNTVPQSGLTEVSILLVLILMFIGACPGSTGGGIKTTTLAVILLILYNKYRGRESVAAFRRTISNESIVRAVTIVLLALIVIASMFSMLMLTEDKLVSHRLSHGWFVDNLFEMVSAFGTVGLSLGMTPRLDELGKIIIIIAMFTGRVGLLTLAFGLARPARKGEIVYSEESVMVG